MAKFEGKVQKYLKHLPHMAYVAINFEINGSGKRSDLCNGTGPLCQGQIESASSKGYSDWKDEVFSSINKTLIDHNLNPHNYDISILEIAGRDLTDTNPTTCAMAAKHAIWCAIDYNPSIEDLNKIDTILIESWNKVT